MLNNVSNWASVLQCHCGSLPNDRDGMSVSALRPPATWSGVNGDAFTIFNLNARHRSNCIATFELLDASFCTQWTVGVLSLYRPTWQPGLAPSLHTSSMTIQSRRSPANSRSEFVMRPFSFFTETRSSLISWLNGIRKTVGGHGRFSPTMTPPTPCPDASLTPM